MRRQELTPAHEAFNQSMSQVGVSVEWLFGDVVNYFIFTDFKKKREYWIECCWQGTHRCAVLRNVLKCLCGNSTSTFFGVKPPTIEEYFG